MKFKLNTDILFKGGEITSFDLALQALTAAKAIAYFLEVGESAISEDLYNKLSTEGKQYFIGVKEKHKP